MSHRIPEEQLKVIILDKLILMKAYIEDSLKYLDREINGMINNTIDYEKAIKKYNFKIVDKKEEIKNYSRQLAQGIINEEIATEMLQGANRELKELETQLEELISIEETKANFKIEAINSLDIINEIIESGDITRRDLEKLVANITITQLSKPKQNVRPILNIDIEWNIFIASTYNIIDIYDKHTEYGLPWG